MRHIVIFQPPRKHEIRFKKAFHIFQQFLVSCESVRVKGARCTLDSKDTKKLQRPFCLHVMSHGNGSSITVDKTPILLGKFVKNFVLKHRPRCVILYSCHAGYTTTNSKSAAERMQNLLNDAKFFIPVIGIGTCESLSCRDDNGVELPQGNVVGFLKFLTDAYLKNSNMSTQAMLKTIKTPGYCHKVHANKMCIVYCGNKHDIWYKKSIQSVFTIKSSISKRDYETINHYWSYTLSTCGTFA